MIIFHTDFVFEEGTKNETVGKLARYGFPPHHLHHYRRYNFRHRKIVTRLKRNQA